MPATPPNPVGISDVEYCVTKAESDLLIIQCYNRHRLALLNIWVDLKRKGHLVFGGRRMPVTALEPVRTEEYWQQHPPHFFRSLAFCDSLIP